MIVFDEPKELIDLCTSCKHKDCIGHDGCKEYKALKKKLLRKEEEPANMNIQTDDYVPLFASPARPSVSDNPEKELLVNCNAAINALQCLLNQESMNMRLPSASIAACLRDLKLARLEAYENMIDWEHVANQL